jgi:hypothetical protein
VKKSGEPVSRILLAVENAALGLRMKFSARVVDGVVAAGFGVGGGNASATAALGESDNGLCCH